jgi:hypothetical protein
MPPERSAASRTRAKSTGPAGSVSALAGSLAIMRSNASGLLRSALAHGAVTDTQPGSRI